MDTSTHKLADLFLQLGLGASENDIAAFISSHHLATASKITEASFWSPAQAQFLRECLEQDGEWSQAVDQLDACLHH